jgi:hypothetical protein
VSAEHGSHDKKQETECDGEGRDCDRSVQRIQRLQMIQPRQFPDETRGRENAVSGYDADDCGHDPYDFFYQ